MERHFEYGKYGPKHTIGDIIKPYGKVSAVLWTGGERYYMCIDEKKTVSMIPALGLPIYTEKNDGKSI